MSKFESLVAFEAALQESRELQEKFEAAKKRIAENKEAKTHTELLVKAAAEVGYTLIESELERALAQAQEVNEEELAKVAGGTGDTKSSDGEAVAGVTITFGTYGCVAGFAGKFA